MNDKKTIAFGLMGLAAMAMPGAANANSCKENPEQVLDLTQRLSNCDRAIDIGTSNPNWIDHVRGRIHSDLQSVCNSCEGVNDLESCLVDALFTRYTPEQLNFVDFDECANKL